ncbi:hypothetical protein HZH68_008906 [Vespula germanica]|uniref:Uncharacterized protein n=1 Tax=Vespula germanica TaxID=30212 RepID=A0A834N7G1_VESGE|nr:hypothetical protein HZH68_008906 [Vespula germanica]
MTTTSTTTTTMTTMTTWTGTTTTGTTRTTSTMTITTITSTNDVDDNEEKVMKRTSTSRYLRNRIAVGVGDSEVKVAEKVYVINVKTSTTSSMRVVVVDNDNDNDNDNDDDDDDDDEANTRRLLAKCEHVFDFIENNSSPIIVRHLRTQHLYTSLNSTQSRRSFSKETPTYQEGRLRLSSILASRQRESRCTYEESELEVTSDDY